MSGIGGFMVNPTPPSPPPILSVSLVSCLIGVIVGAGSGKIIGAWFVGSSACDP